MSATLLVALPAVASRAEAKGFYDEVVAARRCEGALCVFDLGDLGFTITFPGEHAEIGVFKKAEAANFRRFAYSVFDRCIIVTGVKGGPPLTMGRQSSGEIPEVFVSTRNSEVYRTISECGKAKSN